ncbi:hypothetical protein EGV01_11430 [Pseudomonas syringae pv. theae]|nr:hypothetical protein [Pseudomonas syringae pv. theae]
MRQYLQVVSGTENVIHELSSVGNRYRDDWGLVASAWIVRSPPSWRCRSIFRDSPFHVIKVDVSRLRNVPTDLPDCHYSRKRACTGMLML